MNVLYFSSSNRTYTPLNNVYLEGVGRNIPSFFLFNDNNMEQWPSKDIGKFQYCSNCEVDFENGVYLQSLNLRIPFEPDVVILARERWMPEQFIIHECKKRFNSKVYVVEVSSHLINNIENRFEMFSREREGLPQKLVDGYFEHSEFARQRRTDCLYPEWSKKSIVVGNPRYDKLSQIITKEDCLKKYNIEKNKKCILFWGVINTTREMVLKLLSELQQKYGNEYQIFYKPNPQEPYNELFQHQFYPNFVVDGVRVIFDDKDINTLSELCDIHIGAVTSIYNYAFYYNKKVVNLNSICDIQKYMNDFSRYERETKDGVEDSAKFWMNVFELQTIEELKELVGDERLEVFEKTNKEVMNLAKECINDYDLDYKFLTDEVKPRDNFIKLFDEFNDKKASERIINYLEEVV